MRMSWESKKPSVFNVFLAILSAVAVPAPAWACAVCGLDDSAYVLSFVFLVSMPFAVVGVIGSVFIMSKKRKNLKEKIGATP